MGFEKRELKGTHPHTTNIYIIHNTAIIQVIMRLKEE